MKQKKQKSRSTIATIVGMMLMASVVIYAFQTLSNSDKTSNTTENVKTEVQKIIDKDLTENYPSTPREVVKMYLRITQCFYNQELEQDDVEAVAAQAYILFDDELQVKNPWNDYMDNLTAEIMEYRSNNMEVDSYEIEKGSAVKYYTIDERDYASLYVQIVTRDEDVRYVTNEKFILRQDEKGNYKILGWKYAEDADLDEH